jgi:hypothetical protein
MAKKLKPTKAWAVVDNRLQIFDTVYDYKGNKQLEIYPTKKEAVEFIGSTLNEQYTVIQVVISPAKEIKD